MMLGHIIMGYNLVEHFIFFRHFPKNFTSRTEAVEVAREAAATTTSTMRRI